MFCEIYYILSGTPLLDPSLFVKFKLPNNDIFYKAQRIYWILQRFAKRFKKYVTYSVNEDLYGAPLVPRTTIELIQDNCIYKFSVHDLVRIIKSALLTIVHECPCPQYPRNPYTNVEFNDTHLLSIYAFIWAYTPRLAYDAVIQAFHASNFNVTLFASQNRKLLSLKCVEAMVPKDAEVTPDMVQLIVNMISIYINPFIPWFISNNICRKLLYKIFRPYLHMYMLHRVLNHSTTLLKKALNGFFLYNPMFGRDYYSFETKTYNVDTRHLGIRDCIYVYDVLAKNETNILEPLNHVYYIPTHRRKLTRTILTRVGRNEYINVMEDTPSP